MDRQALEQRVRRGLPRLVAIAGVRAVLDALLRVYGLEDVTRELVELIGERRERGARAGRPT